MLVESNKLKTALSDLLTSKKFIAALLGTGIAFLGIYAGLDVQEILTTVIAMSAYITGQGIADAGKEQKKVKQNGTNINPSSE